MNALHALITFVLAVALLMARSILPEMTWLTVALASGLALWLGYLLQKNWMALRSRTAAYGLHSALITVLVLSLVGVLNFLASRYPGKWDLTRNQVHSLSDQTRKVIGGLKDPVKAIHFAKTQQREQLRMLLENYENLSPKFRSEVVDPDKEVARTKLAGIKKYGTLQLVIGDRETKVEEPTEEKITNALIKLTRSKKQTLCALTGHGEKSLTGNQADGLESVKKALEDQSYETREINLVTEGKLPETCDAVAIVGPTKAFFANEVKLIRDFLASGGRAVVALDADLKGQEPAPELLAVLNEWQVRPVQALIVDPVSQRFGGDAVAPLLVSYSKDNPITRDFQQNCTFPIARPLEIISGAPAGMNVQWLAQTTPQSWGETSPAQIASGQVRQDAGVDKQGPLSTAIAVEGKLKDSQAPRNTRLVVFGSSGFATNQFSRFGGNLDFILNAASWVLEDESLISIRTRDEGPGKIELSAKQNSLVFWISVVLTPALAALAGVGVWVRRRRL